MNYDVRVYSSEEDVKAGRMNIEITSRLMHMQKHNNYLKEIHIPEIMMHPPEYPIWTMVKQEQAEYPYTYEVKYWPGSSKSDAIRQWVKEMQIPCTQINRLWYFKTEEDRLLFLMVWA